MRLQVRTAHIHWNTCVSLSMLCSSFQYDGRNVGHIEPTYFKHTPWTSPAYLNSSIDKLLDTLVIVSIIVG